jgi:acetyl esterase/lipase
MILRTRIPLCALTALSLALCGRAAETIDLNRIEPVPADQPIPIQDFFRPLVLQQPKLNLTGTHIAALISAAEDKHTLMVYELSSQKIEWTGGSGDKDIYDFHWLNERRLIFQLSARKLYGLGMFAAEVGDIGHPYPLLQYYGSSLVAVPVKDRLRPLVWNRSDFETGKDLGVAAINTDIRSGRFVNALNAGTDHSDLMDARDNNDRHILTTYPPPSDGIGTGYVADKEGRLEFAFTMQDGMPAMQRLVERHWEKCPVDLDQIDVIDCGDKPGQLVVRGPFQTGKPRALQLMDGATGQLGEVLLQDTSYDFYGGGVSGGWVYRHPVSHAILGAFFERNGPTVYWFTEEYRALQAMLNKFFPGNVVRIIGSDQTEKIFLVAVFSDRQPAIYNWVNLETRKAGLIKKSAPWIDPERMRPMTPLKYKTRDGHELDAYLTLPAGATKQNPPPMIVLPHGGPWARDTWTFNGEVQFLASRGYAVLQPNYRGSNGYAWRFPYEDRWAFRKMHDDVTDATKSLIASGYVDRNRVAIMGGSFGGYLALSGVTNEPELYRCAVTIAGVFDWAELIRERKFNRYDDPSFGYLLRRLGDPSREPEKFDAIAPVRHVDRIRVPVFVAHGKDDPVAEITQSKRLISELNKYHVTHEDLLVSEEGHGMGHLKNEVELYSRIEKFLAKNLAAAPGEAGSTGK